ncbi:MAG: UDP-2,3-diacylglucosamine diphosphatase LpxI [Pseudomonadota bacterium]
MTKAEPRLAILAGRGSLPRRIAEHRRAHALPTLVVAFQALTEPWMADHPLERHRFERPGRLFAALRRAGCTEIVFAGGMERPRLKPWAFDLTAVRLAARALWLLRQGDDAMLRGFAAILEREGFCLRAAHDCLPGLTVPAAHLGRLRPSEADRQDAARAGAILAALGPHDVGQAAVVARGVCLGIEAIEGTDALLARIATLPPEKRAHAPPPAGVLVKCAKPGQDRRLDLPSIGPDTIAAAAAAGLAGIAVQAEAANIIDRAATIAAADAAGLFLWSAPPEALS